GAGGGGPGGGSRGPRPHRRLRPRPRAIAQEAFMPVTPTYPGIYIEELASGAHSVTAAPTSITVFVGYTHPFKTAAFDEAVELFSFTDYENAFGGLFRSGLVQNHVAYAVNDFFLNGGSHAYVVGLQAEYLDSSGTSLGLVDPATAQIGNIVFTA